MRNLRSLRSALAVCAFALVAVPAAACTISSAHVQGEFDDAGRFVVSSMLDAKGRPVSADGFVCKTLTAEDGVAIAAGTTNGTVYVVGDLDCETRSLHVRNYTTDAAVAAAAVAQAKNAGAAGCCEAAKGAGAKAASAGATCSSKGAAAKAASAGAGCGSKGAAAKAASAGAGCGSKGAAAKAASAGASCGSKGAAATAASAGAGCGSAKGASAASAGAGCGSAKGASAASAGAGCGPDCAKECCAGAAATAAVTKTADAGEGCGPDCTKECCAGAAAANQVVFNVSGMTCGGCEGKVAAAVAALKLEGVENCTVSHENANAVLTLADGAEVDADTVAKAISATGFQAEVKKAVAEEAPAETEETASTM